MRKKLLKLILIILFILTIAFLFYVIAYKIKLPNKIYGKFNPPIELLESDKFVFFTDEEYFFDKVYINYWDVHENEMYCGYITDINQVNDIYNLSKQIKVKQKFYNDTHIHYYALRNYIYDEGFCDIRFYKEGEVVSNFYIVDKRFYNTGELSSFDGFKKEIAECELFDYLEQFTEEYDPEKCNF